MTTRFLSAALALTAFSGAPAFAEACSAAPEGAPILNLDAAIARALESDLRTAAAEAAVSTARTGRAIAAQRPADSVSLAFENFPGIGLAAEIDSLEITASFNRVWERGDKRGARQLLADRAVGVAEAGIASSAADIAYEVQTLYVELAIAGQRLALAREKLEALRSAEALIARRVEAARDPLLAGSRAKADVLSAEGEVKRLEDEEEALRSALSGYGLGDTAFAVGFCGLAPDTSHSGHPEGIDQSPDLLRLDAERRKAEAVIRVAEADRVPDITWSAGVRKFGVDESVGVLGGFSIPLGSASRAAPHEQKAAAEAREITANREALRQALLRETTRLERTALNALDAIAALDDGPVPEAERAVELANDGYRRGAFSYLDVLDAQRALFSLREQRLDHLRTYHLAEAAIARVTASNLPSRHPESGQ